MIASPLLWAGLLCVAADGPAAARHFDEEVAPILARHCLECHAGGGGKGGLSLSTEAGARRGGENGPAVEPGRPEDSPLWSRVESGEMPPRRPAPTAAEKETLRRWIAEGATWGAREIDPFAATTARRAGYDWWSLHPPRARPAPSVADAGWARNEVDRFVLAGLEAAGLRPAPEADRRTLARRLAFDLTGLPPGEEDLARYLADGDYEALVDRLLASPRHGERWARHWLDVVRFGESQGYERNRVRGEAWRYRDWVVDALNRDMPYDEFARLQVAGDALRPGDYGATVATGYHVAGTWDQVSHVEGSAPMREAARWDELEDLVGTFGQAFLGLSIQCARCHDHKFDPITQREYYQLAALLGGVNQAEGERDRLDLTGAPAGFVGRAHVPLFRQPPAFFVQDRGDYRRPLGKVSPMAPKATVGLAGDLGLGPDAPEADRRVALAAWLTDRRNPLTARVVVNRLWHHHMGTGLVDTPSDLGFNGGRPSHPELLDTLAVRLMEGGWRLKPIHRLIVTSAAYRQRSVLDDPRAEGLDADNRLLWRANRRRLEGEAIRDAALAVAGALNPAVGGPSYRDVAADLGNNHAFGGPTGAFDDAANRRTIYRLWARSGNLPMLEALDCPDPSVMAPRRSRTITPVQSLSMLNGAIMERCADRLADRVRREAGGAPAAQVARAWRLAFARDPSPREAATAARFVADQGLAALGLVLLNANEFVFVD